MELGHFFSLLLKRDLHRLQGELGSLCTEKCSRGCDTKARGCTKKFDALTSILLLTYTEPRFLEYRVWNMFERDIYHVLNRLEHSQANVYLVFLGRGCKYIFSRCLNCWCSFYFEGFLGYFLHFFLIVLMTVNRVKAISIFRKSLLSLQE